ncbi:AAA family ATPase [Rhodococcus sp. 1.20]
MVKIVSVDEIKDFRIFHKWKPGPTSPTLDHVTLVHANNGSGKSTLASLLNPTTSATGWNAGVTVTIEEACNTRQVTSPDDPCWQNVVVFNHDYVENAVRIKDGTTNALLALGPDAVQRQLDLEKAQDELATVTAAQTKNKNNVDRAERALNARAKAASDEINTSLSYPYGRGYNATNVKKEIDTGLDDATRKGIDEKALLSRACATQLESLPWLPTMPPAPPVSVQTIRTMLTEVPVASHSEHTDLAPSTRDWLETGIALHDADDPCMFCTGIVTQERLTELQSLLTHAESSLSERARRMAQQLETYDGTVQLWMSSLPRSNAGVYDDLGKKCTEALDTARISGEQLQLTVTNARAALTTKAENIYATVTFEIPTGETNTDADTDIDQDGTDSEWPTLVIEPLQAVITEHNARTAAFASEKSAAADRYKLFVLGSHRQQYRAAYADLTAAQEQQQTLTEESTRLKSLIGDLSGGEFDPGPGVTWLNDELVRLLGRDELQLQVLDDRNYTITRYGAKVDHLSEGEKTALALLHFLGSLDDKGRDTQNLCVVIDDPISSLDSDIAFGVSAALWGYLLGILNCRCGGPQSCACKAGTRMRVDQLILFTHNFDFFRHWSNQLDRLPTNLVNNGKKNLHSGLSYVQLELRPRWYSGTGTDPRRVPEWSTFWATGRPGNDAHKERTRLRSEYHFLFHRCATALTTLNTGSATADEQMDAESLLPNASRRLLEGFLAHRHPERWAASFARASKPDYPTTRTTPPASSSTPTSTGTPTTKKPPWEQPCTAPKRQRCSPSSSTTCTASTPTTSTACAQP